jgi:hypothetical protein
MFTKKLSISAFLAGSALALSFSSNIADAKNPYSENYTNKDNIAITGEIASVSPEQFTIDYGDGLITVEMDDWDWFDEATRFAPGEKVTVYGNIDDEIYELRTIEASSVYAYNRNTFYYANDADEEDYYTYNLYPNTAMDGSYISVSGMVTEIDDREITLDTGVSEITIDTDEMAYNPLDNVGYQQVDIGDQLFITGELDVNFFDENEIEASFITSLNKDRTKTVYNTSS